MHKWLNSIAANAVGKVLHFGASIDLGCGKYEQRVLYSLNRRHSNPGAGGRETHRAPA
jgi:hypothetical protein